MEKELRTNARHVSPEEQYQIRKSIVRLMKSGKTGKEIAKLLGVSEGHVSGVKKVYQSGGAAAKKPRVRGRRTGEKRKLTPEQEKEIQNKNNMNADKLIDFMRRLVHDSKKKVFLILDNLRVHHSKKVKTWLEKHKDKIEVFYLPPYAPEPN